MMSVLDDLKQQFGDFKSLQRQPEWDHARQKLHLGQTVEGTVVLQYPFGVFVDIGFGFPALLLVVRFRDADTKPYTSTTMYPQIGERLSARICVFNDRDHEFGLTQLEQEEMLWEK